MTARDPATGRYTSSGGGSAAAIEVVVGADVGPLKKGLNDANQSVNGFGSALGAVGGVVVAGMAAAGAGIAAGVGVGIKAAGDLEQQIANISTIKPEVNFSQVFGALNEMQTRVPQSASALGQGLYDIFSSVEVSADEGIQLLEKFAKGATGAGTDASTWGTAVMGVMNAYGAKVGEVDGIQDVFFNTINKGVVSGEELAASLGPVTQAAKSAGLSIQDLGAYIAASTKEGGPAAQNINNLNNFLQKITTKEAQAQIEALGIKAKTATGEFRPTTEVLEALKERLGGMTEAAKANALQAIFPDAQARQGAMVLMSQLDLVKEATEENQRATGSAAAAYEKMSQTFNSQSKLAVNGLMSIATTIGGELLPHITPLITQFSQALPGAFADARAAAAPLADVGRQVGDAWRTTKQVFGEGWEPSAEIEPLALAAGNAARALRDLGEWAGRVSQAMSNNGALETYGRALETINTESELVSAQLRDLAGITIDANDSMSGAAATGKLVATAFEVTALAVGQVADSLLTFVRLAVDFIAVFGQIARAVGALSSGDMPAFNTAMGNAASAVADFSATGQGSMDRMAERASQAFTAITGAAQTSAPQVVAAVDEMGTGMVGSLEAAGPAMAAAAESGASGAVAAVQGQAGAAHAAGSSVGQNLGDGMQGGILSRIGAVISAARQMVAAALGAGEAEAEIESPSKKTMYWGHMLDEGLIKGIQESSPAVQAAMRDLLQGVTDYAPVAREVARVEREIKNIRDAAQTDALFRGQDMITLESELLRLKRDQVDEERRLLPIRQDLAAAEREVTRITNGSLTDRSALLENDAQRKQIRLQTLDLEKQLVGLDRDSKRAGGIQKQIDALRDQDRLLSIEAERITTTNQLAATAERRRVLGLGEILAAEEQNTQAIGRQITALDAEAAVFRANEAIIKNATDNEIGYRQRLIAVFNAEGKPLADRITAGLALVDQLEAEGSISKELADKLREIGKQANVGAAGTAGLGTAAATAAPQIDAAAKKAEEMARQAERIADESKNAGKEIGVLATSLGKLPSWFTPKGSGKDVLGFGGGRADGGPVSSAMTYLVGERGPELFTPAGAGHIVPNHLLPAASTEGDVYIDLRGAQVYDGSKFEDLMVNALERAGRRGRIVKVTN